MDKFQLIVIGAGPGGYVAAIRAAQLGLKTAVIENREVGGTCLNRGCIPTKSMLHVAELYQETKKFSTLGINISEANYNPEVIQQKKNETVEKLRNGVEQLLKSNGVTHLRGTGTINNKNTVLFTNLNGETQLLNTDYILIATGSVPSNPPVEGMDLPNVFTSDELLDKNSMYDHLIVAGAGVIGMEFASLYNALDKEVTIMASRDRILPKVDKEVAQNLSMLMKKRGIKILTKARLKRITLEPDGKLRCWYFKDDEQISIVGDGVLLSAGRKANTSNLFGKDFNLDMDEKGCIIVDDKFCTKTENIFAIGDVIPGMQLAHLASAQGITVVENILGHSPSINVNIVPDCIYTNPEIACVGMTEEQAKENGINTAIGKTSMMSNGRSMIALQERGFIKVVYDTDNNCIIGAQLMCARATDLINEFTTAIVNKLSKEQLLLAIHPHPTFGEAIAEAIEDIDGMSIHTIKRKKLK